MRISVFGLGYVGCVSAACLAQKGHDVIGVDVNKLKVDFVNKGQSPIVEDQLGEILHEVTSSHRSVNGKLHATTEAIEAVLQSDVSLICVGTPSKSNGNLNVEFVRHCAREIGEALRNKDTYHVVIARSTMLPGTVEEVVIQELELASGRQAGQHFGVAVNPEFLREGTSVNDFFSPPMTIIGEYDTRSGDTVAAMYDFLDTPMTRMNIRAAEMVKYACNAFHAVKVCFANEIGVLCKNMDIDSHKVMDAFCMDEKLNLSSYYLKPGFAFGGSCLPKDLRAVEHRARALHVDVPMLQSVLNSNRIHVNRAIEQILQWKKKRIGILGLSFKTGTDDIRESPSVSVIETLIGKGLDIRIYDRNVSLSKLMGANKEFLDSEIPQIASLMHDNLDEVIEHAEIIVICNGDPAFADIVASLDDSKIVFDLVRVNPDIDQMPSGYEGICW